MVDFEALKEFERSIACQNEVFVSHGLGRGFRIGLQLRPYGLKSIFFLVHQIDDWSQTSPQILVDVELLIILRPGNRV